MGTTAHSLSACSQELLASILCTRSASACMEWQTAHECYIALRSPQMPHKEHGQKCTTNLWWWMWWMPQLSCSIEYTTIRFMCSVSSLLELHCHFLLGRTCPGGPSWRSTPLSYLKASLSFFFFLALIQYNFFRRFSPHSDSMHQYYQHVRGSTSPWIPIYQPVGVYIDWAWLGSI